MPSRLALLLLAAAVLGCARASRELSEDRAGRQLLQTPTTADCNRSVAHCEECRYQFFKGTVTKAICTRCAEGYLVKNSGRACYCAPGFYTQEVNTDQLPNVGFTCEKCTFNHYCPGAKVTAVSSKVQVECGTNKMTTTEYAKSDRECVVKPGFGWAAGNDALECPRGFYNPGYNTRKCTKCPGSLTTTGTNSNSTQDCQAPKGHYYLRGKAVACARGTYKADIANNDCNECPKGMTTEAGKVAKEAKLDCKVVLPGYSLIGAHTLGVTDAEECPENSYRAGETDAVAATPTGCQTCDDDMVTLPNVTRATSSDACVVPPGYGWNAGGLGDTKGTATICGDGEYNPGYNREPCISCGTDMKTGKSGAVSADECYTPAGYGNRRAPITGVLEAYECPADTYGRPNNTYGLVDVECTKCLEHTGTSSATGKTSATDCLTDEGYGWDNGQVNECEFGYFSVGGTQDPCTYCGDFFNTSTSEGASAGATKATSSDQCRVDFGYHLVGGAVEACLRGFYKDKIGNTTTCSQCPAGTSTTITLAAILQSDCDTCRPGFGIAGGVITLTNPDCDICTSGHYSAGWTRGGQECLECPKTQNFTGTMVSRLGAATPEECFGEFITDDTNAQNFLWWDVIPMNDSATYVYKNLLKTLKDCQDGCAVPGNNCQYFEFYETASAPSGVANSCYWRVSGALAALHIGGNKDATWWNAPLVADIGADGGLVLFEIREGSYVTYSKIKTELIGTTITSGGLDFKAARIACDKAPDCIGLTYDADLKWRTFKGGLWEGAVGKVRVVGEAINSWVKDPVGDEVPSGWSP